MSLGDLFTILRILNDVPSKTDLHDEVEKLVLGQIKKELEKN